MWEDNRRWTFSLEEVLLLIMDSKFGQKQGFDVKNVSMDLFLTKLQLFTSQDINWWTGVVWIIVMFLSAVLTLILTAPIHCRESTGEQVMQCQISPNLMKKNSSTSWMAWGWVHFQQIQIFRWFISLIVTQHFCVAQNSVRQIYFRHAVRCCFHQQIYTEQSEDMLQSWFKLQVTPRSFAQWNFNKSFHTKTYVPSPSSQTVVSSFPWAPGGLHSPILRLKMLLLEWLTHKSVLETTQQDKRVSQREQKHPSAFPSVILLWTEPEWQSEWRPIPVKQNSEQNVTRAKSAREILWSF